MNFLALILSFDVTLSIIYLDDWVFGAPSNVAP